MDRNVGESPAPWRVLEDPADPPSVAAGETGGSSAEHRLPPRPTLLIGAAAALLAVVAFAMAFGTGSAGSVTVDGGSPFGSGRQTAAASSGTVGVVDAHALVVEIVGAVERPGVFRLAAGSRVGDLVAAAGGYGPRVDADRAGRELNLAAALHDGDQIRVPSRDDPSLAGKAPVAGPGGGMGPGPAVGSATAPIDLNRATAAELDTLPGIGPATAAKILASRDQQAFAAVEDLRTRKLVGEKTFEKLKDLVAVR